MAEMTLIERAARAMSRGVQNRTVGAELQESEPWQAHRELTVDREWRHYVPLVQDALSVLHELPLSTLAAGQRAMPAYDPDEDDVQSVITAIVDAALAEGEQKP